MLRCLDSSYSLAYGNGPAQQFGFYITNDDEKLYRDAKTILDLVPPHRKDQAIYWTLKKRRVYDKLEEAESLLNHIRRNKHSDIDSLLTLEIGCTKWDRVARVTFPNGLCVWDCRSANATFGHCLKLPFLSIVLSLSREFFTSYLSGDNQEDYELCGYRVIEGSLDYDPECEIGSKFARVDWNTKARNFYD